MGMSPLVDAMTILMFAGKHCKRNPQRKAPSAPVCCPPAVEKLLQMFCSDAAVILTRCSLRMSLSVSGRGESITLLPPLLVKERQ